ARRAARASRSRGTGSCSARSSRIVRPPSGSRAATTPTVAPIRRLKPVLGTTLPLRVVLCRAHASACEPESARHRPPSPMNAPDAVALSDGAQHVEPGHHPTEHGVAAVQVRLRRKGDEELTAARLGPGERHTHGTHVVPHGIHLVPEHEARPSPPIAPRIAVLYDEVGHHPVPAGSVKVASLDQGEK